MANNLTRLVKIGLLAALALTFWKGLMKTPEVASRLDPERFYRNMIGDGENSLIMKERHFDFNHMTGIALEIRLNELRQRGDTPPADALTTKDRLERAIGKAEAKDMRNADYIELAREALERAKLMAAQGWRMPLSVCAQAAPGATVSPALPVAPVTPSTNDSTDSKGSKAAQDTTATSQGGKP